MLSKTFEPWEWSLSVSSLPVIIHQASIQSVNFVPSWANIRWLRDGMNQPICIFIIKIHRNQIKILSTWQELLQLSPQPYWEDNSDMFYINVAALLVNTIVVSYFLNFLSSYVPRNDNVVKHGYAWSFHLWIIMEHSTPQLLQLVSPGPHWEDDSDNVLQFCYHEILNSQDFYAKKKQIWCHPS